MGVHTMAQYLFYFIHDKYKRDEEYMRPLGLKAPAASLGTEPPVPKFAHDCAPQTNCWHTLPSATTSAQARTSTSTRRL